MIANGRRDLPFYISESQNKAEYHRKNANNSLKWHSFMNIIGTIIMGLSSLAMTIMAVQKANEGVVAIVSGCFTFTSLIFNRVTHSWNFQAISIEHNHVHDDFLELVKDLNLLDPENLNDSVYNLLVSRYISVIEKSHVPPIRNCFFLECF